MDVLSSIFRAFDSNSDNLGHYFSFGLKKNVLNIQGA